MTIRVKFQDIQLVSVKSETQNIEQGTAEGRRKASPSSWHNSLTGRFLNPSADIRAAAGREGHLRSMEVLALYPANSIFLDGYLNTKGGDTQRVLQMIKDAGFSIESEIPLEDLLQPQKDSRDSFSVEGQRVRLKASGDLKPSLQSEVAR